MPSNAEIWSAWYFRSNVCKARHHLRRRHHLQRQHARHAEGGRESSPYFVVIDHVTTPSCGGAKIGKCVTERVCCHETLQHFFTTVSPGTKRRMTRKKRRPLTAGVARTAAAEQVNRSASSRRRA